MTEPTNKQNLLDEIERSHQDMMRLLASLTDDEKLATIRDNDWNTKDVLAHLIRWEKMAMDWMTRSLAGEHVKRFIPGYQYDTEEQRVPVMDALNIYLWELDKDRPLAEVMQDFRATHRAIYDFVAGIDDQDLFDPNRFAWRNGSPAADMLGTNTYDHYSEHGGWITEWRANPRRSYPTTKQELARRFHARHAAMEKLLSALTPEQMTAPVLDGGWSVKDSLAHLVEWELSLLDAVDKYQRGQEVKRWADGFLVGEDDAAEQMHKYNAHLYEKNKPRPLNDVLDEFRATYLRVAALLNGLSESEIFDDTHFAARNGRPLITLIAGESYEHYDEHLGWIRQGFGLQ